MFPKFPLSVSVFVGAVVPVATRRLAGDSVFVWWGHPCCQRPPPSDCTGPPSDCNGGMSNHALHSRRVSNISCKALSLGDTWIKLYLIHDLITAIEAPISHKILSCALSHYIGIIGINSHKIWEWACLLKNVFSVTCPFWWESTGHQWVSINKGQ